MTSYLVPLTLAALTIVVFLIGPFLVRLAITVTALCLFFGFFDVGMWLAQFEMLDFVNNP